MGKLESKLHSPGVMIYRAQGDLTSEDLEHWRDELKKFITENEGKGACGVLIDTCELEGFNVEAIDTLFELLADPEETIKDIRMRFALIGVKPFTQRFLREAMPLEEIKHIRARFFHEVSEDEALAWLQAMVSSADGRPEAKAPLEKKEPEPPKVEDSKKTDSKAVDTASKPDDKEKKPPTKGVAELLKGAVGIKAEVVKKNEEKDSAKDAAKK